MNKIEVDQNPAVTKEKELQGTILEGETKVDVIMLSINKKKNKIEDKKNFQWFSKLLLLLKSI